MRATSFRSATYVTLPLPSGELVHSSYADDFDPAAAG